MFSNSMDVLGVNPPILSENETFMLDTLLPVLGVSGENSNNSACNGSVDNEDIPDPVNLTVDLALTSIHRGIIDELFTKYKDGKLNSWLVELVEKRIASELKSYPVNIRVAVRLQLSILRASARIKSVRARNYTSLDL